MFGPEELSTTDWEAAGLPDVPVLLGWLGSESAQERQHAWEELANLTVHAGSLLLQVELILARLLVVLGRARAKNVWEPIELVATIACAANELVEAMRHRPTVPEPGERRDFTIDERWEPPFQETVECALNALRMIDENFHNVVPYLRSNEVHQMQSAIRIAGCLPAHEQIAVPELLRLLEHADVLPREQRAAEGPSRLILEVVLALAQLEAEEALAEWLPRLIDRTEKSPGRPAFELLLILHLISLTRSVVADRAGHAIAIVDTLIDCALPPHGTRDHSCAWELEQHPMLHNLLARWSGGRDLIDTGIFGWIGRGLDDQSAERVFDQVNIRLGSKADALDPNQVSSQLCEFVGAALDR